MAEAVMREAIRLLRETDLDGAIADVDGDDPASGPAGLSTVMLHPTSRRSPVVSATSAVIVLPDIHTTIHTRLASQDLHAS